MILERFLRMGAVNYSKPLVHKSPFLCCFVFLILCLSKTNSVKAQDAKVNDHKDSTHILFIGNSFTHYHKLPQMIAALAEAGKQHPLKHESETPGGCTFEKHWKDGKALKKLHSRKWDYVVLQDQSQMPLLNPKAMQDFGAKLDNEIKKHGAKTILYMTWAVKDKPEDQVAIAKAYQELGEQLHAKVAPVGIAWEFAQQSDKKLVLHEADKKHPNSTGTYLAACVFYATIYGKSPEGLPGEIGNLTDEQARPLQRIAWKAVGEGSK